MKRFGHPATIIAAAALFMTLGGGAYAAASKLISGSQIKNHTIAKKKLTPAAISALKGASGPSGPPGPSAAYSVYSADDVNLDNAGETVATLTLGSGSYVVMANTTLVDNAHGADMGCYLYAPTSAQIDVGFTSTSPTGGYPEQASIALMGPLTTSGGDVTEWCLSDDNSLAAVATDPRIVAIKVGSVTGTLRHHSSAKRPVLSPTPTAVRRRARAVLRPRP